VKQTAVLTSPAQAHATLSALWSAIKPELADGKRLVVTVREERKTRDQEKKYHAQIGDLAAQWRYLGVEWDEEDMKRILVNAFKEDTKTDPELAECWREMGEIKAVPGLRGGLVILGDQTRRFPKKLASAFVEWLYALGAEVGVEWTEPEAATAFAA
jgi:hypothetical protein